MEEYSLDPDFETIKNYHPNEWKYKVTKSVEEKNKERLTQDLHKTDDGQKTAKTKTATIVEKILDHQYIRKPIPELLHLNKHETRTLIMARYGMLECGRNRGGSMKKNCESCNIIDDEEHRLNKCTKWENHRNEPEIIPFEQIYSNDLDSIKQILYRITSIWNTKNGQGSMIT